MIDALFLSFCLRHLADERFVPFDHADMCMLPVLVQYHVPATLHTYLAVPYTGTTKYQGKYLVLPRYSARNDGSVRRGKQQERFDWLQTR